MNRFWRNPTLVEICLLGKVAFWVVPRVEAELRAWRTRLCLCPDPTLKYQALQSMQLKRFHAQGGSLFALSCGVYARHVISSIVALQTISDYLDNLCDRMGYEDETTFRTLHQAMTDAVSLGTPLDGYYDHCSNRDDGGYLRALVEACRRGIAALPSYTAVEPEVTRLARLYSELQVYKHLNPRVRESKLEEWFSTYREDYPMLTWPEFGAACGSTLGIFALFQAAAHPGFVGRQVSSIVEAYFPWICGLHILLDYLIDQAEDRETGDLNFVSYYPDPDTTRSRLLLFLRKAMERAESLPNPEFHRGVVKGLVSLYLSDPKVKRHGLSPIAQELLASSGPNTAVAHVFCRAMRTIGVI